MSSVIDLQDELVIGYVTVSACVLFLYESLSALSHEVDVIWRRKRTISTWLYAATRYGTAAGQVVNLLPAANITYYNSCKANVYINRTLFLMQYLCIACFSALRVYALLDRKYLIAGIVFILNIVPLITNMVTVITHYITFVNSGGCVALMTWTHDLALALSLATGIAVTVGDVLVLVVTWTKTGQTYFAAQKLPIKAHFATILLRDGTVYFILLLIINILVVVNNSIVFIPSVPCIGKMIHTIIGPTRPALGSLGIVTPFYSILPSMIICRFMLNLRHIEPAGSSWMSGTQSRSMRFVGNMGKSLQIGGDGEDDEDDEENGPWSESVSAWADVLLDGVTGPAGGAEADKRHLSHNHGTNSEALQLECSASFNV